MVNVKAMNISSGSRQRFSGLFDGDSPGILLGRFDPVIDSRENGVGAID